MASRRLGTRIFVFFPLLILFPLTPEPAWHHRLPAQSGEVSSAPDYFFSVQRILLEKAGQKTRAGSEAAEEVVLAKDLVYLFYTQREFRPAWIEEKEMSSRIRSLLQLLKNTEADGLDPSDYHLSKIEAQFKSIEKGRKKKRQIQPETLADFDLLCTDAFLTCAGHLAHGKVDPETHVAAWQGTCIEEGLAGLLEDALTKSRVVDALESLPPQHSFYQNLKMTLASHRELARKTKWKPLPEGFFLKKEDKGKEVKELRKRMLALGDLGREERRSSRVYDGALEAAFRRFQSRHGLDITGSLDPPTLAAMNVPLGERCLQIEANLERWRWLPHDLGERYIYVNVANFKLEAFEGSRNNLAMKVVAGSEAWQTPDFASQMTHLVVNPDWTIPIPVLLKETVNYVLQDPCYFRNNKMVILKGYGEQQVEIDPASIDWTKLNEKGLDFRVRQEPGPQNILGRLKFVFPNKYEIFLHDTPYQEDFVKVARAFSHGCIRAEKPIELAVWVLRGKPGWDLKQILAAIDAGEQRTVKLAERLDVFFLYNTAWAEDDGTVQFRPDIYERDKQLTEALAAKPPLPQR